MGYAGKLEEKIIAQKLRKQGLSYGQILKKIKVSKDTLSRWCRDISLTEEQKQKLMKNKIYGQKKGSIIAAENKIKRRIREIERINKNASKEIGKLKGREDFLLGIALYAGEGIKSEGQGGFSNSNPYLIKFMMSWFRKYCKFPEKKYRGAIWLHEGLNKNKAILYWSKITKIPQNQFFKTYITKNKIDSKKISKNIHLFGVFSIRFSDTLVQRRILGWISAVFNDKIPIVP